MAKGMVWISLAVGIAGLGIAAATLAGGFGLFTEGSEATLTSRTDACSNMLVSALEAFRRDAGMPFQPADDDPNVIFDTGHITKSYNRDGTRYEISFRVARESDLCKLVAYQRRIREPGSVEVRRGQFGSVDLTGCTCE